MKRLIVIGGGAAGFFGAIACAEAAPDTEVIIFEKGPQFLQKVRISGGGRCNVTHACFDPRELTRRYPRGERELIGPYHQFQARDTVQWFERRGVELKVEGDGRMFPATNSSQTIIDCLLDAARARQIRLVANRSVETLARNGSRFTARLSNNEIVECDRVLLATGGCRTVALGALAVEAGHQLVSPVPSLFTFHVDVSWVRELAGVSVPVVAVSVPGAKLRETGPLLFTHWGLSGPAILRLSAWGARELHVRDYNFDLHINWLPSMSEEQLRGELKSNIAKHPSRLVVNKPLAGLPSRLWEKLVDNAELRWSSLGKAGQSQLTQRLTRTELRVTGKSLNKDEFVTCGGVKLNEVDFRTMESGLCPGLYFAGEVLDIDGITGGFNFQAAWTTGWIAGRSIAASLQGRG